MIVVTGATGFIGRHVTAALVAAGHQVRTCVRSAHHAVPPGVEKAVIGDLGCGPGWGDALLGARCVLHLAGRAHTNPAGNPAREAEFRRVNVTATQDLAHAAVAAGASRFVFVSSIGVNGSLRSPDLFARKTHRRPLTSMH